MTEPLLGRYRLIQRLAAGGMGEVFLARQEGPAGFARLAVVKRILVHLANDPKFVQMFLDEARLAAVLSHPNVVQIFELGEAEGTWFIAMEYLHGRSLKELRSVVEGRGEQLNTVQAARIMVQALDGLHYAHTAKSDEGVPLKLVHRDVSPENIVVGFNGAVKVLDFGIAKAANAVPTTNAGMVKGKFAYMAPEQLRAEPLDGRADVFAAGIVLYELLSGQRPFASDNDAVTMQLILNAEPAPGLETRAPNVPRELCAVVMRALEKLPGRRWQTAGEFARALEYFVTSLGEPGTNATTSLYMKALFGEAAAESSPILTPSQPLPVVLEPTLISGEKKTPSPQPSPPPAPEQPTRVDARQRPPAFEQSPLIPEGQRPTRPATQALSGAVTQPATPAHPVATPGLEPAYRPEPPVPEEPAHHTAAPTRPEPAYRPPPPEPASPAPEAEAPLELARELQPIAASDEQLQLPSTHAGVAGPPPRTGGRVAIAVALILVAVGGVGYLARAQLRVPGAQVIHVPSVSVTSDPPGAALKIDGEAMGVTPWSGSNLWRGEVTYEVSAPGRVTKRGTFRGAAEVTLDVRLPKSGR